MSVEKPSSLSEAFQATAAKFADEIALRTPEEGSDITWSEYANRVERIARGLSAIGVRPGDTVAMMTVNRPEFHLVDAAALHLGATPFAIYGTSATEQIVHLFENAANRVVVTEPAYIDAVREAAAKVPAVEEFIVLDEPGSISRRSSGAGRRSSPTSTSRRPGDRSAPTTSPP